MSRIYRLLVAIKLSCNKKKYYQQMALSICAIPNMLGHALFQGSLDYIMTHLLGITKFMAILLVTIKSWLSAVFLGRNGGII